MQVAVTTGALAVTAGALTSETSEWPQYELTVYQIALWGWGVNVASLTIKARKVSHVVSWHTR